MNKMSRKKCMRSIASITLVVAIALTLAYLPCIVQSAQTAYPWNMFRHDIAHTGYTQSSMPDNFVVGWKYETGHPVISSPTVVDGKVYVGSNDKFVYCLDAADGTLLWKYGTGSVVFSSPAVVDGNY